jgi:phospholipid-binding lipoprotein MlaA
MPPGEGVEHDPWEKHNRRLFRFNEVVDKAVTKPIARGYNKVVPKPVRKSVTNFSANLATPGSALNNFLQGKPAHGFQELARFVVNSTFGIGGLFDVATYGGIEKHSEDFGQTVAVWGVPAGPYLMFPFLGPRTVRSAATATVDSLADPLYHYDVTSVRDKLYVLRLIDLRSRLLSLEEILAGSKDPYVTVRESYLQNREFEVYDGDPPITDDEDLYDEFLEEEDY